MNPRFGACDLIAAAATAGLVVEEKEQPES
jgi:hypothetical protein